MYEENEIIAEIHRHREEFARECGFDIHVMFQKMREDEKRLAAEGWKFVTPEPRPPAPYEAQQHEETCTLREEPPKS